jgi:glutaconate CoA-transferase subunit A
MGVPYVPIIGLVGTDLLKRRDDMVVAVDPFDGKTRSVVARALRPDVAVFHAQKADRQGNVSCGYEAEVVILAEASRHVIVTAEQIVDRLTEKEATGAFIPAIHVDAVAHAPFGAHPAGCAGLYGPDRAHMARYVAASQNDASFDEYLRTCVLEVSSHEDYVERFVPRDWRQPARAATALAVAEPSQQPLM